MRKRRDFPVFGGAVCLLALLISACTGTGRGPVFEDTTLLLNTFDTQGPYQVDTIVYADAGIDAVSLYYRIDGGDDVRVDMELVRPDRYSGLIPGQAIGTVIDYAVRATDIDGNRSSDPPQAPDSYFSFRILDLFTPADLGNDVSDMGPDVPDVTPEVVGDVADAPPPVCQIFVSTPSSDVPVTADQDERRDLEGIQITVSGSVSGTPASGADMLLEVNSTQELYSDLFNRQFRIQGVTLFDGPNYLYFHVTHPDGGSCELSLEVFASSVVGDSDGDGIVDEDDNCPFIFNPDQANNDNDEWGDVCDDDDDNDDVPDLTDNCLTIFNPDQADTDRDGIGDACEGDRDGDGVDDVFDNCPDNPNPDQQNSDDDDLGDACDPDDDNDGVLDGADNCPVDFNPAQEDSEFDSIGDICDPDDDNDTVLDDVDNCPFVANPSQDDSDGDGIGDLCDEPLECVDDDDCPDNAICDDFHCIGPMSCMDSTDCDVGFVCRDSVCVPVDEIPAGFCFDDSDCEEGFVCTFNMCTPERCYDDGDCPPGQQCLSGECLTDIIPVPDRCETDEECAEGERCLVNFCVPTFCDDDGDCGGGDSCVAGFCVPFDPPIDIDECSTDDDCSAPMSRCYLGICIPPIPMLPDECVDDRDCPEGQACFIAICMDAQCFVNADCPEGQECIFGFCSPEDLPPPIPGSCAVDDDCPDGSSCVFSICIPDNAPIPRLCDDTDDCPPALTCRFGICLPF